MISSRVLFHYCFIIDNKATVVALQDDDKKSTEIQRYDQSPSRSDDDSSLKPSY